MEEAKKSRWTSTHFGVRTLACLIPLWFLSVAIMVEGFPRPPITIEAAGILLILAVIISIVLLSKGWMPLELLAYSLTPLLLAPVFDEISTTYKSPFILLCAILLSLGVVVYHFNHTHRLRVLILLAFAILTLFAASHAGGNFWKMAGDLGYVECFPDYQGCAPLTGNETPWWILFLGL